MAVTGLAAVAAATERLSTCGPATASGRDPYTDSADMSLISAAMLYCVSVPLLLPALSLPMARVFCSHGSVRKAKFNFAGISKKPEPAPTT